MFRRFSTPAALCVTALALAACASSEGAAPPPASPDAAAAAPKPAPAADATSPPETVRKLQAAAAGKHRSDKNRARDAQRHPVETLSFFGLRDDMNVVELWPGGGWFTEILAPVLAEKGHLTLTSFRPKGEEGPGSKALRERIEADPQAYGKVAIKPVTPADLSLGPDNSADLVVTFRNVHNWLPGDNGAPLIDPLLAAAFRVLKPGGVLGVEEHRANAGTDVPTSAKTGYVSEQTVIEYAEKAGFKLAGKSEVNANPKDTKDHPKGVWTLPPVLELKDQDRAKYEAIGESDRMTLKFVKPAR